ncbi:MULTISPECIES: disulfide bond formation protein B [unclassified Pseudomonas]|uniref:disulfide bond formation protein B n=1 Tax=unclassified Pseudomonas TaxID=196821 RepID=UPI0035BFCC35
MSLACLRTLFLPALLGSLATLLGAILLETHIGLLPCPLCQSQRLVLALYALVCLCAMVHAPGPAGERRYQAAALAFAVFGALLAGRHVWLQGEWSSMAGCPLPLGQVNWHIWREALEWLFVGGADCVSITWSFLDLTVPEWSLLAFLLLASLPLSRLLAYRFRNLGKA